MSYLGTRETREAREVARRVSDAEREHRKRCLACIQATSRRQPGKRCPEGGRLFRAKRDADAQLKTELALDKLPNPNQEALFDARELAQ